MYVQACNDKVVAYVILVSIPIFARLIPFSSPSFQSVYMILQDRERNSAEWTMFLTLALVAFACPT